jgi:hypothetical protein
LRARNRPWLRAGLRCRSHGTGTRRMAASRHARRRRPGSSRWAPLGGVRCARSHAAAPPAPRRPRRAHRLRTKLHASGQQGRGARGAGRAWTFQARRPSHPTFALGAPPRQQRAAPTPSPGPRRALFAKPQLETVPKPRLPRAAAAACQRRPRALRCAVGHPPRATAHDPRALPPAAPPPRTPPAAPERSSRSGSFQSSTPAATPAATGHAACGCPARGTRSRWGPPLRRGDSGTPQRRHESSGRRRDRAGGPLVASAAAARRPRRRQPCGALPHPCRAPPRPGPDAPRAAPQGVAPVLRARPAILLASVLVTLAFAAVSSMGVALAAEAEQQSRRLAAQGARGRGAAQGKG